MTHTLDSVDLEKLKQYLREVNGFNSFMPSKFCAMGFSREFLIPVFSRNVGRCKVLDESEKDECTSINDWDFVRYLADQLGIIVTFEKTREASAKGTAWDIINYIKFKYEHDRRATRPN